MPRVSSFSNRFGREVYMTIESYAGEDITHVLKDLFGTYASCMRQYSISEDSEVFIRIYLSDIAEQGSVVKRFLEERGAASFYSLVGQQPASGKIAAIEVYHIASEKTITKGNPSEDMLLVSHGGYRSLWSRSIPLTAGPAGIQTEEIYNDLSGKLKRFDATIKDNVMRTWIYIRNIDDNYHEFSLARNSYFSSLGMTKNTHTIASTGIEGLSSERRQTVIMDSLSILGINRNQIEFMSAPDYMCPTYQYDVTFERGTKITFADRTHYHISGTASIDREGNVLYPGDIERQALRILENMNVLLSSYGSGLNEMKMLRVYIRNVPDFARVKVFLMQNLPEGLPFLIVRGAVCRPAWLIEMDGIAVSSAGDSRFEPFC